MTLSRSQWVTLLEDIDPPTYGEILAELKDRDVVDADPDELLEAALEEEILVEDVPVLEFCEDLPVGRGVDIFEKCDPL